MILFEIFSSGDDLTENAEDADSDPAMGLEELQRWWEIPAIAHFCCLFAEAFSLNDYDIEELEAALLAEVNVCRRSGLMRPRWARRFWWTLRGRTD